MRTPSWVTFEIVYQCDGQETHEESVVLETFDDIDNFAYEDADECEECRDYDEISRMTVDRIEVNE